ncbi:MAG: hypothetical protein FWH20_04005 [Oscillospiraceae bacterium]|nr:hypothetical protein [Oscillospiraceae bacterium]
MCSDECRKVTASQAKQQFKERNKDDKSEQFYEGTYQYWYNRLRKLKRNNSDGKFEKEIAALTAATKKFRTEAVKKKADVKSRKMKLMEFRAWLLEQQNLVDGMMKWGK